MTNAARGYKIQKVRKVRKIKLYGKETDLKEEKDGRFIVSVKVGPKGQITIPVEARRMFDIKEGDTMIVLGDKKRGIALLKTDLFYEIGGMGQNDGD